MNAEPKYERNPLGVANQCTASAGKGRGRCPNAGTKRYGQRWSIERNGAMTERIVWMNRCDAHPMSNAVVVEPIESPADTTTPDGA